MELIQKFATKSPCWENNVNAKALYDSGVDRRYWVFQQRGPQGLMLHSVGCAQPSAAAFDRWDNEDNDSVMVHAFIDANDGSIRQRLPWNYRGWHCGGTGNNTHIGVEMCESNHIRYINGYKFEILNKTKAQAQAKTAYDSAVELFAYLCQMFNFDPLVDIISHKEGAKMGIASDHGDPEHYWSGLGMAYTMDGFRQDVKKTMEEYKMYNKAIEELTEQVNFLRKAVDQLQEAQNSLRDNDAGAWSASAREKAIKHGIIKGIGRLPDGTINYAWESAVTREQLMTFLDRLGLLKG